MADTGSPRFGLSIVASCFAVQALSLGLTISAYPVLMAAVETEFGLSRTAASFGIPAVIIPGTLVAPWIGRRLDRGSPRVVMVTGALLMAIGHALLSVSTQLATAAFAWIVLLGLGHMMLGPLPAMTVLANWFVARRGTMIAVAAMGTTFGGALVPPLCERLIDGFGWRGAVLRLGIAAAVLGVPIVWLGIVGRPEEIGAHPDGAADPLPAEPGGEGGGGLASFLRDPRFWLGALAFAVLNGGGIAFLTHVVPIALERGFERDHAVALLTVNAVCAAAGKLVFGALLDRIGVPATLRIATTISAACWLGLTFAAGGLPFAGAAAGFSFGLGCMIPGQAGFVGALYGRARFGQASGLLGLVSMVGALTVPPLVGAAYDTTGSYDLPLRAWAVAVALPIALFSWIRIAPPRPAVGPPAPAASP